MTQESVELEKILAKTDISNIDSIEFTTKDGLSFTIKNENIIKMSVYISEQLKKTEFWPGELTNAFHFLINNFHTDLPENEYKSLTEKVTLFIEKWGTIEIIPQTLLGSLWIKSSRKIPSEAQETETNMPRETDPTGAMLNNMGNSNTSGKVKNEKWITFPRILFVIFIIQPISWGCYAFLASIIHGNAATTFVPILGILFLSISIFVLKRVFQISILNAIVLYFIGSFIGGIILVWIFLIVCWGMLLWHW